MAGMMVLASAGLIGLFLWWVARLNRRAAARIQQQIDALD
jgi:hypothetical protein